MDSLTLFGHLFKTRCEAICIFLDFFTEKRGSQREIYDFFRKSHETHCICKRFSIYCNKNCSGNMRILCPFAEITYTPSGDENHNKYLFLMFFCVETTYAPSGDENFSVFKRFFPCNGNNLRPVRGRKPGAPWGTNSAIGKQLTPRQGTKTRKGISTAHQGGVKQLTPRQGTKTAPAHRDS